MNQPSAPSSSPEETELLGCLRDRRAFWLYGFQGCGKTRFIRQAADKLDLAHTVEIVSLYPQTSKEQWCDKLFDALPDAADTPPSPKEDVESIWRGWCERYAEHAAAVFVVIDGWQWMPAELHRRGAELLGRDGLACGFVACAAPRTYLCTAQILSLDVIECPLRPRLREDRLVRAALCRDLFEGLSDECVGEVAPLVHLPRPLSPDVIWRHFDRSMVLPALDRGLLYEHIDSVAVAQPLRAGLCALLEPRAEQWVELLACMWEVFRAAAEAAGHGSVAPGLVQATLEVFAQASMVLDEPSSSERAWLKEVMLGLDAHFRTLLTPSRLPAALEALELIPSQLLQAMPVARLRLGQCLPAAGRTHEADRLLDGLVRMKHTDAGKRAFLWTQMFAALGGNADEAIDALRDFLDERVEPGEPLDAVARLVLTRILTTRGLFRQALPVAKDGIRAARANRAMRDLHMLRTMHGMCLALTGDRDAGVELVRDACDTLHELGFELAHAEARHLLATLYLELGAYDKARVELRAVRPEYERLRDTRNLKMLQVKEHIIALSLDEEQPPCWTDLDKTPAPTEWSLYQAELSFAQALHAMRSGDTPLALDSLQRSVDEHLTRGNVQALRRLLAHYLPLLLDNVEFARTRSLLTSLDAERLAEQDLGEVNGLLVDATWLTGDFGHWGLSGEALAVGGPATLFPRAMGHTACEAVDAWAGQWEATVCAKAYDGPRDSGPPLCAELAALRRGWQKLWDQDQVGMRRALKVCEELDLEGSLFGFLRGLLHHVARVDRRCETPRRRSDMLEFWRRLSPMHVIHQLGFWEHLLEQAGAQMPEALAATLCEWLDIVQKWRIDGAMLIDEELGEVLIADRRIALGADTVAFSVLCHLAGHARGGEPVAVDDLFTAVWDRPYNPLSSKSNVYVTIANLRQALDIDDEHDSVIQLDRGVGYSIGVPVVVAPTK